MLEWSRFDLLAVCLLNIHQICRYIVHAHLVDRYLFELPYVSFPVLIVLQQNVSNRALAGSVQLHQFEDVDPVHQAVVNDTNSLRGRQHLLGVDPRWLTAQLVPFVDQLLDGSGGSLRGRVLTMFSLAPVDGLLSIASWHLSLVSLPLRFVSDFGGRLQRISRIETFVYFFHN